MRSLCFAFIAAISPLATSAAPKASDTVLVKVNGVAINRSQVMDRAWKEYGTTVLNQIADELVVHQVAAAQGLKADKKEVDVRIKRIRDQFPDEATFAQRMAANGSSLEDLRSQIEEQVLREALIVKVKGLSVSDAEAKDFFDKNKDRLGTPEALHLRHILVATEKEAADFLVALKADTDFAKLASQISQDNATKDKGGDLGFISRGMLQPEIEQAVFSLKKGDLSSAVKSPLGFHIFKVEDSRPTKPAVFKEIQGDLKQAILSDKISKAWPDYIRELRSQAKYEPVETPGAKPTAPKKK